MAKTKHTPGPWEVEDPMGAEIGLSIVQADLKTYEWEFIAMVCQSTYDEDRVGRQRFISPKEQEANAYLIAAAPDMFAALEKAVAAFGLPLRKDEAGAIAAMKAAITKAAASPARETK